MASAAARRARRWPRWKCRPRDVVPALLLVSLLTPLALYSGAPISPFSGPNMTGRRAFRRDPFIQIITRSEMGKRLNTLAQNTSGMVKEPVQRTASAIGARGKEGIDAATDYDAKLGHNGVSQQHVDKTSVSHGSSESTINSGNILWNGEELKEVEPHDPVKRERVDDIAIARKKVNYGGGEVEARRHKALVMHGNSNATLKKENTDDGQSSITIESSNSKAIRRNINHRTSLPDAMIRTMKGQLRRAKTYIGLLPSRGHHAFVRDLRRKMKDIQQALGDATIDRWLPKNVSRKIKAMELALTKIKLVHENCAAVIDKLLATLHLTEDQAQAHKEKADYAALIAAKALPKKLYCLALRLTNEYYSSNSHKNYFPDEEKFEDSKLQHYAFFSDNVLAAAVVVNSTLVNAKNPSRGLPFTSATNVSIKIPMQNPSRHVFHIVTDKHNYAAMRMWFLANHIGKIVVQVQNIEDFTWLNSSYSPVMKQLASHFMINYYFKTHQDKTNLKFQNPKYLSILNHLRFYLPEIFPKLNKVLFLDDDIVVQQDLSNLWSIDLKGKVNGAVHTCGATFHRFDRYLNFSNPLIAKQFDRHACGWAYGMNMFDLSEWRKQNITDVYHYWQNMNANRQLWKLGTLPAGLVTFWNRTFPLDRNWHLLGLGYKPNVDQRDIERAAVLHYNGNRKPWLEIGLPRYRKFWSKYVNFDHAFLRECNIHP